MKCQSAQKRALFIFITIPLFFDFAQANRFLVTTIKGITDNRKTVFCQMHANLMSSAGQRTSFNPGIRPAGTKIVKISFRRFTMPLFMVILYGRI